MPGACPPHRNRPIQRRAYDGDGRMFTPMTLGDMRAEGLSRVHAYCTGGCEWNRSFTFSTWPDDVAVADVGLRLACPQCGCIQIMTRPAWTSAPPKPRPADPDPDPLG